MNKRSNNAYLGVSLATLASLSMLFSSSTLHFHIQLSNAQNSTTNSTGILPPISQEQQQQLAANGTSFDGFIKHRIAAMNAAKIPVNYTTAFDPPRLSKIVNVCVSPLGKVFAQTVCDFVMATVYEMCQAIPDQLSYLCLMPAINSYIKDRNMVDGQTDKLAWQFALHREEITANPFESSTNSTAATITNATTMGQTQGEGGAATSTKKNDSISFKTTLQLPSYPGSNTFDIPQKSNFTFGSGNPLCLPMIVNKN